MDVKKSSHDVGKQLLLKEQKKIPELIFYESNMGILEMHNPEPYSYQGP